MKDEKERMQEYLKDYTNAHGNLPKNPKVDKVVNGINIGVKTIIGIIVVILILMSIPIFFYAKDKTAVFFTMDKEGFVKKLEKDYKQSIEIVEDYSSPKGNGNMVMRTLKEPQITFNTYKTMSDFYSQDYEARAFIYYLENIESPLFDKVTIEKGEEQYGDANFLTCTIFLNIDSADQIESACKEREELFDFMKKKMNTFEHNIYLKIGEYRSWVWALNRKSEEVLWEEETSYRRYLNQL